MVPSLLALIHPKSADIHFMFSLKKTVFKIKHRLSFRPSRRKRVLLRGLQCCWTDRNSPLANKTESRERRTFGTLQYSLEQNRVFGDPLGYKQYTLWDSKPPYD